MRIVNLLFKQSFQVKQKYPFWLCESVFTCVCVRVLGSCLIASDPGEHHSMARRRDSHIGKRQHTNDSHPIIRANPPPAAKQSGLDTNPLGAAESECVQTGIVLAGRASCSTDPLSRSLHTQGRPHRMVY